MAETSVSTLRMRSPSTITMALVQTLPLPSTSFPKRSALTFPGLFGVCCAKPFPAQQSSSERHNQPPARSFKGVHLSSNIGGRGLRPRDALHLQSTPGKKSTGGLATPLATAAKVRDQSLL